jgi:hypothetical protein
MGHRKVGEMRLAIMQPYFLPYIGYFQLIAAVDQFIVYDNIKYTKKGWINRNRVLVNGKDDYITLPLKKDSDYLSIAERTLADSWPQDRVKLLNRMRQSYMNAQAFEESFPLVEACVKYENLNLFLFILNSIELIKNHLGIKSTLVISSTINADHSLKSESRVISICNALQADEYINPIGGLELYSPSAFASAGLTLKFLKARNIPYQQDHSAFVPFLSIIDMLMFCGKNQTVDMLGEFDYINQEVQPWVK